MNQKRTAPPTLALSSRHLLGLLTALGKRALASTTEEKEESALFTNEALMSQIQCNNEAEIILVEKALAHALRYMWTDDQLRAYLTRDPTFSSSPSSSSVPAAGKAAATNPSASASATEEDTALFDLTMTEEQVGTFLKYWAENKDKLRARLAQQSCWNRQYTALLWRTDLRTLTSDRSSSSSSSSSGSGSGSSGGTTTTDDAVPMAYFEMQTSLPSGRSGAAAPSGSACSARFEMDLPEVRAFNAALDAINEAIRQAS